MAVTIAIGIFLLFATYVVLRVGREYHREQVWAEQNGCKCRYTFLGRLASVNCPIREHSDSLKYCHRPFHLDEVVQVAGYSGKGIIYDIREHDDSLWYDVVFHDVPKEEANIINPGDARKLLGTRTEHFKALGCKPSLKIHVEERLLSSVSGS